MDFRRSTQARSWMFDAASLDACREKAVSVEATGHGDRLRPRKFASGFHRQFRTGKDVAAAAGSDQKSSFSSISVGEQELVLRFHARQIQSLVGPTAILPELRNSETVVSTAITFFRRFYLSNSVAELHPRTIAAASAFLASKVEEERVEIGLLAHATAVVQVKVQNAPLCRRELCAVTIPAIEEGERLLMEGLNFELRCHHPDQALCALASDLSKFLSKEDHGEGGCSFHGEKSPRSATDYSAEYSQELLERALEIKQRALIFSDAPFLFTPNHFAFAIMSLVLRSFDEEGRMGLQMRDFLDARFPRKSSGDIRKFSGQVEDVIKSLLACPSMDLLPTGNSETECVTERAEELRDVLTKAANVRLLRHMSMPQPRARSRKRSHLAMDFTPPRNRMRRKYARITPNSFRY